MRKHVELDVKTLLVAAAAIGILLIAALALFLLWPKPLGSPQVRVAVIGVNECADCFDTDSFLVTLQERGVNVTSREYADVASQEGRALIERYKIQRVPSILVFGANAELEEFWASVGERRDDALVLTKPAPVYIELASGKAIGRVKATIIEAPDCPSCDDLEQLVDELKNAGVRVENFTEVPMARGQELISRYNITILPTVLLSAEAQSYDFLMASWKEAGTVADDGTLVLRATNYPFYDVPLRRMRGLVSIIVLNDSSCTECYDPYFHVDVLTNPQGMGMQVQQIKDIDASSEQGKALIKGYAITQLPTVLVGGDVDVYPTFLQVWPQVGTKEADGTFIFRGAHLMGGARYRDLVDNTTKLGIAQN